MLLDARRRVRRPQLLDVGGDMHGLEEPELGQPPALAPAEEVRNGQSIGWPGVAVADVGGEELEKTPARVRASGSYLGRDQGVGACEGDRVSHENSIAYPGKCQNATAVAGA